MDRLSTYITYNRQTSMTPFGFEPTISVGKWSQIYVLDHPLNMDSLFMTRIQPDPTLFDISR